MGLVPFTTVMITPSTPQLGQEALLLGTLKSLVTIIITVLKTMTPMIL